MSYVADDSVGLGIHRKESMRKDETILRLLQAVSGLNLEETVIKWYIIVHSAQCAMMCAALPCTRARDGTARSGM
jgi:hypothetical protein